MSMQKYDLYKNEEYIDEYTITQLTSKLLTGSTAFKTTVEPGTEIRGYTIKKAQTDANENYKRKVLDEWDEVRFRLNPRARLRER